MNLSYGESLLVNALYETGDPEDGAGAEEETANKDNEVIFDELVVKEEDPETGKMFDKTLTNVTRAQSRDLMLKGVRFESKNRAFNVHVLKEARNIAKEMVGTQYNQMQAFIKENEEKKVQEEALKPPTAEEMEKDPEALSKYLEKRDAILISRVKKTLTDADKDRADEGTMFNEYNAEIGRAVKAFPLIPRKVLTKAIQADDVAVENVFAYAEAINQEFVSNLDLDSVPEEQRNLKIKAFIKKNKAPKPPKAGPDKPVTKKKFKTMDEMLESHLEELKREENL